MKILVCGDFHGTFLPKFKKIIAKEGIDALISLGDYPPFHYRKLWFKHCFGKNVELSEIIGKKRYKKLVKEDLRMAEVSLRKLNELSIPVFTVLGNMDYPMADDVADVDKKIEMSMPNWERTLTVTKIIKRYHNIRRFDYKYFKFDRYIFIGMRGHSFPGRPKSRAFKKHSKILEKIFKKFRKENKQRKVIFISHIVPYNTKLDKIGKHAHKEVRGQHYGSILMKDIVKKFQPTMAFGGHIHEGIGRVRIGRTLVINPGAAHEGKAVIVEFVNGRTKEIKLIK